ncbi:MAG: hypothetical protein JWP69_19 [Flaviaesturariibacter sp.]|nr:hypothetical protein [Flaviaesturariibacter sp.]
MQKLTFKNNLLLKPYYLILLIIFFVFHGYVENYDLVPVTDCLLLVCQYTGFAILSTAMAYYFLRSINKAALFTFFILSINFFFGAAFDVLKKSPVSFLGKYSVILLLLVISLVVTFIYLKKSTKLFYTITKYLNFLFVILLLLDIGQFTFLFQANPIVTDYSSRLTKCDTCATPDIYLIVADEYAGNRELLSMGFDNRNFFEQLKKREFNVIKNTTSNYNPTEYSMASLFNMQYLKNVKENLNTKDIARCFNAIDENEFLRLLPISYKVFNFSNFRVANQEPLTNSPFYSDEKMFITEQTLLQRLMKDIGYHLYTKGILSLKNRQFENFHNNKMLIKATKDIVTTNEINPKFVYTHLTLPHYPYYFDKDGKQNEQLSKMWEEKMNQNDYLEYLQYSNRIYLELIDWIITKSKQPPIILLISDHGFRQFEGNFDKTLVFSNLIAVHLPSNKYGGWYEQMSNVNILKILLNSEFQQKLTIQKDSLVFIKD